MLDFQRERTFLPALVWELLPVFLSEAALRCVLRFNMRR